MYSISTWCYDKMKCHGFELDASECTDQGFGRRRPPSAFVRRCIWLASNRAPACHRRPGQFLLAHRPSVPADKPQPLGSITWSVIAVNSKGLREMLGSLRIAIVGAGIGFPGKGFAHGSGFVGQSEKERNGSGPGTPLHLSRAGSPRNFSTRPRMRVSKSMSAHSGHVHSSRQVRLPDGRVYRD